MGSVSVKVLEASVKVLVADELDLTQGVISALLKSILGSESEVVVAKSGTEALRKLQEEKFDLAVLSIELPGMNGIEVARAVPQQKILFTSASFGKEKEEALKSLPREYPFLMKPLFLGNLRETVYSLIIG